MERRRKDREEAHLYIQVIAGTEENFNAHQGFDIFPTASTGLKPEHPSIPKPYRVLKSMAVVEFNEMIAKDMGVEPDLVRPWGMVGRQNSTTRPDSPLIWLDHTIEEAMAKMQAKLPFRLWIEVATQDAGGEPQFLDHNTLMDLKSTTAPILLFLKYFDIENQTLKGAGHIFVDKNKRIPELGPIIQEKMGWDADTKLKLYEEIKAKMIEPMNAKSTLGGSELQHGDIICFQKSLEDDK